MIYEALKICQYNTRKKEGVYMTLGSQLKTARKQCGWTQKELAHRVDVAHNSISNWENDQNRPDSETLRRLCEALDVTPNFLYSCDDDGFHLPAPLIADTVITFPVLVEVAAGFDKMPMENWNGEQIEVTEGMLHGRPREDFFAMRVRGDSMYPELHDGDILLILRQTTIERSGEIGVIDYGDGEATIKKIEYVPGEDWMRLIAVNPMYPPRTITGTDLEQCRVLGVPRLLFRSYQN